MELVEGATETDESRLFALIALISDAKACASRLDELRLEQKSAKKLLALNEAALAKITAEREASEANLVKAQGVLADAGRWNEQLKAKEKDLAERLGVASDRERDATKAVSNVRFREAKVGERETTMDHREAAMAEREKAAEERMAEVQALLADYDEAKHKAALKLAS